jgi:hypothetical protein
VAHRLERRQGLTDRQVIMGLFGTPVFPDNGAGWHSVHEALLSRWMAAGDGSE